MNKIKIPKQRKEGEYIPEGWSVTETEISVYLRFRDGSLLRIIRIKKSDFEERKLT